MSEISEPVKGTASVLVDQGRGAMRAGDRNLARHYFTAALAEDPTCASAWRGLADVTAEPHTALKYLAQAQTLAPDDASLRLAMQAVQGRLQQTTPTARTQQSHGAPAASSLSSPRLEPYPSRSRRVVLSTLTLLFLVVILVAALTLLPGTSARAAVTYGSPLPPAALPAPAVASAALTGAGGGQPAPVVDARTLSRPMLEDIQSACASVAAMQPRGSAVQQTAAQMPADPAPESSVSDSRLTGKWIDIDLTRQTLTAYEGDTALMQVLVSTGTRRYPTPTGRFTILRKYRAVSMSGPGYYLPNVPWTMFFYGGFAIHGTYWHENFGHPMSHGCINMRTDQAAWLYNWAPVGTLVVIHY